MKLEKVLCYMIYSVSEKISYYILFYFQFLSSIEYDSIISQRGLGFLPLQLLYFTVFYFYFILLWRRGHVEKQAYNLTNKACFAWYLNLSSFILAENTVGISVSAKYQLFKYFITSQNKKIRWKNNSFKTIRQIFDIH